MILPPPSSHIVPIDPALAVDEPPEGLLLMNPVRVWSPWGKIWDLDDERLSPKAKDDTLRSFVPDSRR